MEDNTEAKAARKQAGNDAFRTGEYAKAVEEYTAAIELDDQDHVLFSNRAGAYSKMKENKKALADSEECIRLNRTWPKGYARKATALFDRSSFKAAQEMYMKAKEYETDATKQAAYDKDATRCEAQHKKSKGKTTDTISAALHFVIVVLGLLSVIPLGFAASAYYWCLKISMAVALASVFATTGRPRMNADFARQLLCHKDANRFFGAGVCHLSRPFILGAAPQVIQSGMWVAFWLKQRLPSLAPGLWSNVEPRILLVTSNHLAAIEFVGTLEVITGFSLLIEVFLPIRNIMVLFMQWQLLRMRYMLQLLDERSTKETIKAFANVRARTDTIFLGTYCPSLIGRLYTKIVGYMGSLVDPHTQKAQEDKMTGMMPDMSSIRKKCTVM